MEKRIEGPAPGTDNNWGSLTKPIHSLRPVTELIRATPGSRGLNLSSTTSTILTPDSTTIKIPTGVKGQLPTGLVGIILGRSSLPMQGLTVIPRVIDSDYTGEIQIMISLSTKTFQMHQGERIAQLLLLPYHTAIGHTATQNERQDKGFGSSDMVFWITEITQKCPTKTILVSGKSIVGLLDTEADVSCISGKDWPSSWQTHTTENELAGLGRAPTVAKSAKILDWQFEDSCGTFQPYVVPLIPFTLWVRDVLS